MAKREGGEVESKTWFEVWEKERGRCEKGVGPKKMKEQP